jgi:hypothetical protein
VSIKWLPCKFNVSEEGRQWVQTLLTDVQPCEGSFHHRITKGWAASSTKQCSRNISNWAKAKEHCQIGRFLRNRRYDCPEINQANFDLKHAVNKKFSATLLSENIKYYRAPVESYICDKPCTIYNIMVYGNRVWSLIANSKNILVMHIGHSLLVRLSDVWCILNSFSHMSSYFCWLFLTTLSV